MTGMHLHIDTLRRLLRRHAKSNLENMLTKMHPADLALIFRHITEEERAEIFLTIPTTEQAAEVLSELDETLIPEILSDLPQEKTLKLLKEMDADDEADILQLLPDELSEELLKGLKTSESEEMENLMAYPENTAGGLMTPEVFTLHEDVSVGEAIASIQSQEGQEMVFYLYVVDEREHLVGVISLRDLITSKPSRKLKDLMTTHVHSVNTDMDQEEVAHIVSRYNILAVPVVDETNKLLGIVTVDDVLDVVREEATEDFLQMAGAGRDREILLKNAVANVRARFPWLLVTWLGEMVVAAVIASYADTLTKVIALVSFMPIINAMSGNVGTQTATIIVRGLATGRVATSDAFKTVFKEIRVGLILSLLFAIFLGASAYTLGEMGYVNIGVMTTVNLSLTVAVGIILTMTVAALVGAAVPLILHRINLDPAIATGPFVTTSVDIMGVSVYFLVASIFIL